MLAGRTPANQGTVVPLTQKPLFQVAARGEATVITLAVAMLDGAVAKKLSREVRPLIPARTQVIVDLGPAVFFDADGLNALWEWIETAHQQESNLRLCSQSKSVNLLLQITRVVQAIPVHATVSEALQALRQDRPGDGSLQATGVL